MLAGLLRHGRLLQANAAAALALGGGVAIAFAMVQTLDEEAPPPERASPRRARTD